jgi:hypothetical protein
MILVALLTILPTAVYAESDILSWLGELSGPGPFTVKDPRFHAFEQRVYCQAKSGLARMTTSEHFIRCVTDDETMIRRLVTVGYSFAKTDSQPLFKDATDSREVRQFTLSVMYMYRATPIIDVGGGFHALHYSADDGTPTTTSTNKSFGFWRFGLTPARVTLTPFRAFLTSSPKALNWERFVRFQFEEVWLPQGFTGADFNNADTKFKVGGEFQSRASVLFDLGSLYRALR